MSVQDYRVNAEVRRLLVSRWVDVSQLQVGTTNGVVYVLGHLDTTMEDPRRTAGEPHRGPGERVLLLAMTLDKELRRVRDVRDVVFKLDNVVKRAGRWRTADGTVADQTAQHGTLATLRPGVGRTSVDVAADADDDSEAGMS